MYEQADLSVGGGNYAIEISHIYNSNQAVGLLRCGVGWKLNVYQRLISKDDGTYKYIDGSGGVNTFVLFDSANSRYYNTIDAGQVLSIVDGRASITDGIGNKINFNENGYVVSVVSALNANIKKIFEYDTSGNLVKIYDARLKFSDKIKTYITFEYDHITGLMTSISAYDKYTRLVDRYVYEYDNGYLVEIYHVAINSLGEELTRKCIKRFSYNSEGKLSLIVDTETRSASVFTYAGNRVSKVDFGVINDQAAVGVQLGESAQEKSMNFQDRISTNPGRVTLKNVSTGETATYDLTLADSPTQVGTALNKETFESFQAYIESMIEGNSGPQGPQGAQGEPGVSISNKSFLVGANTQENTGWFKIGTVNVPTYIDYHAKMVITSTYMSTQMPSGEVSIDLRMGGSGWTGTYVQWTNLKGPHPEYLRYYADPSGLVTFYVYVPACWGFYRIDILGESNRDCVLKPISKPISM